MLKEKIIVKNQNLLLIFEKVKQIKIEIMKKITLVLLLMVSVVLSSTAQTAGTDCKKTCEVEKVVQEGTLLGVRIQGSSCNGVPGVKVLELVPNSAAVKFEFQLGDLIQDVDGEAVTNTRQMVALIQSYKPSDLVTITFTRKGEELTKDVILGAKKTTIVKETVCCDVKEDQFFNALNMNVYPNPASSFINFSMSEAAAGKYTFQVFNTVGAEVYVEVENFEAGFSKKLDLTEMAVGEYFLKITKGENTITKAFVVAK